jgi:hypothetical protein
MGIIIEGHVVVSTKVLKEHDGCEGGLKVHTIKGLVGLYCVWHGIIAEEPAPRTDLPCGCIDKKSHDEDLAVQLELRKKFRIPKSTCVGCYLGDDGISIHSCAIHPERYWPEAS